MATLADGGHLQLVRRAWRPVLGTLAWLALALPAVGPCAEPVLSTAAPGRPARSTAVVRHGKGELRIVEGVPFLKLAGTYREMGIDYGVLMKDRIRDLLDAAGIPELARHTSWLDRWRLRRRIPGRLIDLVDGIAEGSGLPWNEVFWLNFAMPGGCSSLLARSGEGLLHGHNQDRPQDGRFKIVVEFAPKGLYRHILTSYVGTIDALEGMNEKGITLTQDAGSSRPAAVDLVSCHARNREILESAASLKDVEALLDRRPGDGNILVVGSAADASGAAYDLAGGRWFTTALGERPLVATNLHLSEALGEHPEECPRYASLRARLEATSVSGVRGLVAILGDPGALRGTNNETTVHSLVLDPAHRTMYMSFASAYAAWGRWLRYDWPRDEVTVFAEPTVDLSRHEVRLKSIPAHRAAHVRATLPSADAQDAYSIQLWRDLEVAGVTALVMGCTTYHRVDATGVDLEIQIPVSQEASTSPGVSIVAVPATLVAATIHRGPYEGKPQAYDELRRWMARNGYTAGGPASECYLKAAYNEKDPSRWLTEIRLPVTPTGTSTAP